MRYNRKKLPSALTSKRGLSGILSHRMFKTVCIATMVAIVVLLPLVLVASLMTTKAKGMGTGTGTGTGINLTVSSTGGNASSPLLYGIMFEVRDRQKAVLSNREAALTGGCRI